MVIGEILKSFSWTSEEKKMPAITTSFQECTKEQLMNKEEEIKVKDKTKMS